MGNIFISFVSSLSFLFLSSLFLSLISSTISSITFLPFSGRRHKMTHKGWRVVKPQHNQSKNQTQQTNWPAGGEMYSDCTVFHCRETFIITLTASLYDLYTCNVERDLEHKIIIIISKMESSYFFSLFQAQRSGESTDSISSLFSINIDHPVSIMM